MYTTDHQNPQPSHIAQPAAPLYSHPPSSGSYPQTGPATVRLDLHSARASTPGPLSEGRGRSFPTRHMDPQAQPQRHAAPEPPSYPYVSRSPIMARHRSDMSHSVSDMSLRPRTISTNVQSRVMAEDAERTPVARYTQTIPNPSVNVPIGMGMGYPDDMDPANIASKYECEYCGKGFSRPSSLKVRAPALV